MMLVSYAHLDCGDRVVLDGRTEAPLAPKTARYFRGVGEEVSTLFMIDSILARKDGTDEREMLRSLSLASLEPQLQGRPVVLAEFGHPEDADMPVFGNIGFATGDVAAELRASVRRARATRSISSFASTKSDSGYAGSPRISASRSAAGRCPRRC